MSSTKVTLNFPSNDEMENFLSWFCDGGGEDYFFEFSGAKVNKVDYGRCFPAWGYDPEKDGDPVVEFLIEEEE